MCYVEGGMKQVALLSLLVLQVAAYHGGGSSVPQGALCQINVAQVLVGRGQARIFFHATNAIFWKDLKGSL